MTICVGLKGGIPMNSLEAREWLKNNTSSVVFACNRFSSKEDVLKFVENLYQNGALEVLVDNISDEEWRIQETGGPYADTLIVKLPEDYFSREALHEIHHEEFKIDLDSGSIDDLFEDNSIDCFEDFDETELKEDMDDEIIFWWD